MVSLSFILPHPPEDKQEQKEKNLDPESPAVCVLPAFSSGGYKIYGKHNNCGVIMVYYG